MSAIIDNNTALETMRKSNEDVLTLIKNLKALLTGMDPVTFSMGDYTITVDSFLTLIDKYRNGKFDSIIIGGQSSDGRQVKISVSSEGVLQVTDVSGSPVPINCAKLNSAYVENSIADKVTANNCSISNIIGRSKVSGGSLELDSLKTSSLTTDSLRIDGQATIKNISVDYSIACMGLTVLGNRRLTVKNTRNVFYYNGVVNDVYSRLIKSIVNGVWDMTNPQYSPAIFGVSEGKAFLPGMISIQGTTIYNSLASLHTLNMYVQITGQYNQIIPTNYDFPALILWPMSYYDKTTSRMVLTHIAASDDEKDIYYMTGPEAWTIYRTMTTTRGGGVSFGNPYLLPAYSCIRFIVSRRHIDDYTLISILELA